ncbi:GIY-YIG nuclease family protein [Candidatus Falkowbacteria bacterium]|nr:MAG: GIY-YIG nuclease family protein [Candidatus Falkowbacteria bacterium]
MWHIYILECSDKTLYTGVTTGLKRRLKEHNTSGLGAKYTKGRRPVKLVFSCRRKDKSRALKEEFRIKKLLRADKLKMIKEYANKKHK